MQNLALDYIRNFNELSDRNRHALRKEMEAFPEEWKEWKECMECMEWIRQQEEEIHQLEEEIHQLEEEIYQQEEEIHQQEEEIHQQEEEIHQQIEWHRQRMERIRQLGDQLKEHDSARLASVSYDTTVKIWDASSGECLPTEEVRIFEIPGQFAGHSTKALGDYGAKKNFIKEDYAFRLGLPINRDVVYKVTVGSGKSVTTTGAVTAPFRFKGEHDTRDLTFHLLPNCIHDVILGKSFLKLTKTFSKLSNFYRRVKERVVKGISQFHLLYLGASGPMFEGSINGQSQAALADSGAKVLVMDEAYARSSGVFIQAGHEHRTTLKFADNSTVDTSGMAYDVEWRFGRDGEFTSPYRLNFHILKNAPANVILCDTFLYDNEAFSRYHHYLVDNDDDYEDEDDKSHCFAIDVDRRNKRMQSKKFTVHRVPKFTL